MNRTMLILMTILLAGCASCPPDPVDCSARLNAKIKQWDAHPDITKHELALLARSEVDLCRMENSANRLIWSME